MATLILKMNSGESKKLETYTGATIMEVLSGNNIRIAAPCGGRGRCGKCRVYASGSLSQPDDAEIEVLGEAIDKGVRLACRAIIEGDAEIIPIDYEEQATIEEEGVMQSFDASPLFSEYGLAVDIGTTTVVARLYGREGLLSSESMMNPQRSYGADVITRIEKSLAGEREALASAIRQAITELIIRLCKSAGVQANLIDAAVITGNTTMLYLLEGRDVDSLSHAPFTCDELFGKFYKGGSLGLDVIGECNIYIPRCMAAFVGADITTAFLASGIYGTNQTAMMVDIGTNGEIALWHEGRLICTSTAAGPVFEGATLSQGMQGALGAIEHVSMDGDDFVVKVIGDTDAVGICGSGIIDAVACFIEGEIIEESGIFAEDEDKVNLTPDVAVTQKDIRMVQLAKGAVCAGMMTLMDTMKLSPHDIDKLSIAGGFGSHLDVHSAAVIGLYPEELESKVSILGNAALGGAAMILLNSDFIALTEEYVDISEIAELSNNPIFTEYYMDCMQFGE